MDPANSFSAINEQKVEQDLFWSLNWVTFHHSSKITAEDVSSSYINTTYYFLTTLLSTGAGIDSEEKHQRRHYEDQRHPAMVPHVELRFRLTGYHSYLSDRTGILL